MSLILIFSIIIRLVAMGWSIVLLRSMRNWRMGFLTVMLGLMALRQTLTLLTEREAWVIYVTGLTAELPGLIVSIMTFLAIFFLERAISEQRRARQALQESEERYRMLFNSGNDALFIHQLTKEGVPGKFIEVNDIACHRLGYTKEQLLRLSPVDIVVPEKLGEIQTIMENILTKKHSYFEIVHLSKDGKEIPVEISARVVNFKGQPTVLSIARDITERNQAEDRIRHLQSVLAAIRNINQLIVHEKNQKKLLQGTCDILNQAGDYMLVWIGLIEEDTKEVLPIAQTGFEEGYLTSIRITWDDSETGKGPTGTAIKTKKPSVMRDIAADNKYGPWRKEAMKRGYASSVALPLVYEERVFGALNLYATLPDAFDEEEMDLLLEVSQDVAFALHSIEIEEEKKRTEEFLQNIIDSTSDLVCTVDLEGNFLSINNAVTKQLGYEEEDLIGRPKIKLAVEPELFISAFKEVLEKGSISNLEMPLIRKDGTIADILYSVTLLRDNDGNPVAVAGFGKDITERKHAGEALWESNRRLTTLMDNLPGMVYRCLNDKDWTMEFVSEGCIALTGYEAPDLIHNKKISYNDIIHPDDYNNVWDDVQKALENHASFQLEYRIITADKTVKWVWERGQGVYSVKGKLAALEGFITDITERKRAEEELRKYQEHLEELVKERTRELEEKTTDLQQANILLQELDRLKSMFIASMSHELRTPLNSIIGFTGIILQGMVGEITAEQRKQLAMVKNSGTHLLALINDVIDVSKIEAGKVELAVEEFDLSSLLKEVEESLKITAAGKGLKISLKTPGRLVIRNDKRRTKQVLLNLLSNAVKFTDKGGIEIKLEKKDRRVEVSVRDTGVGIRQGDMDKLFTAFGKIDPGGWPLQEGTGLGLYLSQKIAKLLGGSIRAESEFGRGSKFTFILPL